LHHLPELVADGLPVLVGTSRKTFLGRLASGPGGDPAPVTDRLAGSIATATWAMLAGASMVRVHDVSSAVEAATLVGTTRLGAPGPRPAARSGVER
jgi:dihydropteroate synthase